VGIQRGSWQRLTVFHDDIGQTNITANQVLAKLTEGVGSK
jgi:hypothetical protein